MSWLLQVMAAAGLGAAGSVGFVALCPFFCRESLWGRGERGREQHTAPWCHGWGSFLQAHTGLRKGLITSGSRELSRAGLGEGRIPVVQGKPCEEQCLGALVTGEGGQLLGTHQPRHKARTFHSGSSCWA